MKKRGFTLIEVIVVLGMLVTLLTVVGPKVSGYRKKANDTKLRLSAMQIVTAVEAYNLEVKEDEEIKEEDKIDFSKLITISNEEVPKELLDKKLAELKTIAKEGKFTNN